MDYISRKWNKKSAFFTEESNKVISELAFLLNESKAYVLNMLVQKEGNRMIKQIRNKK